MVHAASQTKGAQRHQPDAWTLYGAGRKRQGKTLRVRPFAYDCRGLAPVLEWVFTYCGSPTKHTTSPSFFRPSSWQGHACKYRGFKRNRETFGGQKKKESINTPGLSLAGLAPAPCANVTFLYVVKNYTSNFSFSSTSYSQSSWFPA